MSLDFINLLTTLDQGLLGLTLFLAPDCFWNPADGLLPSFVTKTSSESNHFVAFEKVGLMGSGATMLSFLLYHFFFMKDESDKRVFMRVKLFGYIAKLVLFAHTAFVNESDMFSKPFFAFFTADKLYSAVMLSAALLTTRPPKREHVVRSKRTQRAMMFTIRWTLFWAIVLIFFTDVLSPNGFLPFARKTASEDNSFDALQTFILRFEGANLLCTLAYLWNFQIMPRQVDKLGTTALLLYIPVFLRGVFDTTGVCNRKLYALQLLLHSAITIRNSKLFKTKKTIPRTATPKKEGKPDSVPVPELKAETADRKKV